MLFAILALFCGQFVCVCGLLGSKIAGAKFLQLHSHITVLISNCVALTRLFFESSQKKKAKSEC
jgi:hypothetical protein